MIVVYQGCPETMGGGSSHIPISVRESIGFELCWCSETSRIRHVPKKYLSILTHSVPSYYAKADIDPDRDRDREMARGTRPKFHCASGPELTDGHPCTVRVRIHDSARDSSSPDRNARTRRGPWDEAEPSREYCWIHRIWVSPHIYTSHLTLIYSTL